MTFGIKSAAVALIMVLSISCSSSTQGEKMVQSYASTRETVAELRASVDATLVSLHHIRILPAQHLQPAFREYSDAIDRLEKDAASAKWRNSTMKEQTDDYVRVWQEEMATINDPAIKSTLDSRRQAVRTNFALIQLYVDDVRKAYEPFIGTNKDVLQALSIDISPAAVTSLAPAMDRIAAQGETLQEKLAAIQHAMGNIVQGISPLGDVR